MGNSTRPPLRLTLDIIFKIFFKQNPHLLKPLLQDFLPLPPGCEVVKVDLLDSEENSSEVDKSLGKTFILDMKIRLSRRMPNGELIEFETVNVEMQTVSQKNFTNRLLAYAGRVYSSQIKEGEGYEKLRTFYSLVFTTMRLPEFRSDKNYYHVCSLRQDRSPHLRLADGIRFVVVELEKFILELDNVLDQREAWCYLLRWSNSLDHQTSQRLAGKGKDMGEALKSFWNLSKDELMRERLEAEDKQRRDQVAQVEWAREEGLEKGIEKGREEGIEKGREEGIEKGREEGIEKGREEGIEKGREETALRLLQDGFDIERVCQYTKLSRSTIERLKQSVSKK